MIIPRNVSLLFTLATLSLPVNGLLAEPSAVGKNRFNRHWTFQPKPIVHDGERDARRTPFQRRPTGTTNFEIWSYRRPGDGLGPLHNATSCADCHPGGGASGVEHNVTLLTLEPRSRALSGPRPQYAEQLLEVFPALLQVDGGLRAEIVVHDHSTLPGYAEMRQRLAAYVPGGIDADWFEPDQRTVTAISAQPVIAGRHGDVDFYLSQRNSPPLFGMGLIDKINTRRLEELAASQSEQTGGKITGRVAGKFGWRGQIRSLANFVSLACANELGLTQAEVLQQPVDPAHPDYQASGIDIQADEVRELTRFVSQIPAPVEHAVPGVSFQQTDEGENVFNRIGCVTCHVADVHPATDMFSDLLLHDMGPDLQAASPAGVAPSTLPLSANLSSAENMLMTGRGSGFPLQGAAGSADFSLPIYRAAGPSLSTNPAYYGPASISLPPPMAIPSPETPQFPRGTLPDGQEPREGTWDLAQREWRTPPLWGVASTAPYLHDGRAATLKEAILWHGGEAQASRDQFAALSGADQELLIAFLRTLQAPPVVVE